MNILHLSSAKSWRGGEQQLAYLLEEHAKTGVNQLVYCPAGSPMEAFCLQNHIPCKTYKKVFSLNPFVAWKLKAISRKAKIDLIHTHDNHAHSFVWMAARFFGNAPKIVVSRRVDFSINKSRFSLAKYLHPRVAGILCVSSAIRDIVLQDYPYPEKVKVVYSGIDLSRFDGIKEGEFRASLGLSPNDLLIGNVAAIAPHKDYFTFVDTVEILRRKGLKATYLIIGGDGGEEKIIREYVQQKGLEKVIQFTGFRKDIPQVLKDLDLLLFTSKTEGLGTTLLDALASKLPVVASRAGGIPEIIRHGETGLTAKVGDASTLADHVLTLSQDKALCEKLSTRGEELVKQFSKSQTAAQTLDAYRDLLTD
ncbi:MAG: glycosyltransferase family 4 protein [Bacteroidetes bacterium]|nr:glycosyltransferase family 4 protein [Bacteroidota bacterium]